MGKKAGPGEQRARRLGTRKPTGAARASGCQGFIDEIIVAGLQYFMILKLIS